MSRVTCEAGQAHILKYEGCRLTSYRCSAGVLTIGVGHTGPEIVAGLVWTEEQAKTAFQADLRRAEKAVSDLVRVPTSDLQHAVLVSFVFNLGRNALAGSTLLRLLNAGNYAGAGNELARWVHVGAQVIAGLVRRRAAEREMWFQR
jgi:lysozyme